MQYRQLGNNGPLVSALGYGAMVLMGLYGGVEEEQSIRTIRHALDAGINFIDTADAYIGNEQIVGRAIADRREQVVLATKFGIVYEPDTPGTPIDVNWDVQLRINGRTEYVHRAIDASLQRLGTDYVDLWYLHYPDPSTPIEETVGAMAEIVQAGKVRYLGLSNVNAEQLSRAHAVHPITAVQNEYSLWARGVEAELLPTTKELGIGFVPWAPLGSGFLSGQVTQVAADDFRTRSPRYSAENLQTNYDRFAPVRAMAAELNVSPAQLALAWLLHQGKQIVPIPGTRKPERIDENVAAINLQLTLAQLEQLNQLAPTGLAVGKTLLPD